MATVLKKWEHTLYCDACKSKIAIEGSDIRAVVHDYSVQWYYIECPECNLEVKITNGEEIVPRVYQEEARIKANEDRRQDQIPDSQK
jgi:Zn finger protein HypA/HybF involved in hydrogenase expression